MVVEGVALVMQMAAAATLSLLMAAVLIAAVAGVGLALGILEF